jgi:hypothetical protein
VVTVAAVLARKLDDVGRELFFVVPAPRALALCRTVLAERGTGTTLGNLQLVLDVLDDRASVLGRRDPGL